MAKKALLVLADGTVFDGYVFGAETRTHGEVVFSTSMTGYQEMLTDPSFAGQILVPTYPLIGNYGINDEDCESKRIQVSGFVVREDCEAPSHNQSRCTVSEYLARNNVPGIYGVDTRAITRRLRSVGVLMGTITSDETPDQALQRLKSLPYYGDIDFVKEVTAETAYQWQATKCEAAAPPKVVVVDLGVKFNIMRILTRLGCRVTVVPSTTTAGDILAMDPDGVVFSPGPGDPVLLDYVVGAVRAIAERKPVLGICLGHQLMAHAFGGKTYKLKFGHRGGNHPVRDLATGRVHITAQNHGYAVDADSLKGGLEVSHINLNDDTVEGMRHRELPILTIQYHSEASPGPRDNEYIFEEWMGKVAGG
ncbi:MAG: glutamine-hydrolyzing carbamoyl-phosphate synthase small subunit [Chloroflexi bacterium]|nr:glutamine-hydrolyzing carbamoyl-phosphate synthase small subunit [Chloroflexota bacterium]